jgi:amino acid adenylation domain-containing protein
MKVSSDVAGRAPLVSALSYAQERLWFYAQRNPNAPAYNTGFAAYLDGALDREALARAVALLPQRHGALRTRFATRDGEPVQVVEPDAALPLFEHDFSALPPAEKATRLDALIEEVAWKRFDLEHAPLAHVHLVKLGAREHALVMVMHHIVGDTRSFDVILRDLSAAYSAYCAGEEPPASFDEGRYAQYALVEQELLSGERLERSAAFWRDYLAGAPARSGFPADRTPVDDAHYFGTRYDFDLEAETVEALRLVAAGQGATLFTLLLSAYAVLLSRFTGQPDVVIGVPVANRTGPSAEGVVGMFVNVIPVRANLAGVDTFADAFAAVRRSLAGALEHQHLPLEKLIEAVRPARDPDKHPIFQTILNYRSLSSQAKRWTGLDVRAHMLVLTGRARFDSGMVLEKHGDVIRARFEYETALYDESTAARVAGAFASLLQGIIEDPGTRLSDLPLISAAERRAMLVEWNATETGFAGADRCVHELFEERVAASPDAPALIAEGVTLTYGELNARANRLAHHLRGIGVRPESRVALCLERSAEMVVALLAVLKAGGAYLPLDPAYPVERLRYMLDDGEPVVVLSHAAVSDDVQRVLRASGVPVLDLREDEALWAGAPAANAHRGDLRADNVAYVIYTSGSTGQPKGVMNEHRGVTNRLLWAQSAYDLTAADAVLQKTPFSFDVSVWEFFWTLLSGARLVVARPGGHRDPAYLCKTIRDERITTIHFVPSMLQAFLEHDESADCDSLRLVICSGEALSGPLARLFAQRLPGAQLVNLYGPTEAAVDVTHFACPPDFAGASVPIGRPVANTRTYVLDAELKPVPVGVTGELHIGGVQVARGYLNRPELTAQRFVASPFVAGDRLYKTGDLARYLADGTLEYVGRNDFQVKIRGFRIELGEIEARLADVPGIREPVVVAREDAAGEKQLVAYYLAGAGAEPVAPEALRAQLLAALPEHMVPAAYVALDAFPLSPNGKLARKALPAPDAEVYTKRAYEAPQGEIETAIARTWCDMLHLEQVGRHDNFFELGGHSLMGVRMLSRVRHALGVDVALADFFAQPVLADFARAVAAAAAATTPQIVAVDRGAPLPASFAQRRLWFLAQMEGASEAYHVPLKLELRGELDRVALRRSLDRLMARHEALRTTFANAGGEPVQRIAPDDTPFALAEIDLRAERDARARADAITAEEASAPFDVMAGPLIRGRLVTVADGEHVLLITAHHIVFDWVSTVILVRELGAIYEAFRDGRSDPLPPLELHYADYAAWQQSALSGDALEEHGRYWRETLAGAPAVLELPTDRPHPVLQEYTAARVPVELSAEASANIRALSRRHGTTPFMTLLTAWGIVLSRLSRQEQVVIGAPSANRTRAEVEDLIGFFVNMLPLLVDCTGNPSVSRLLERVKTQALAAQQHQDLPFEQIVELVNPPRSLAHTPIFQASFAWQDDKLASFELAGLDARSTAPPYTIAKFDVALSLAQLDDRIVGGIEYATSLFDRGTVERFATYLRLVLDAMVADETQAVEHVRLLPDAERAQVLVAWNDTARAIPGDGVAAAFERQVRRAPDAVAVVDGEREISYADVDARANRLARRLRAHGVEPGANVAILLERSTELVVAELAILKAGAAYVPLDPNYPPERLRFLLDDAGVAVVVSSARAWQTQIGGDLVVVDAHAELSDVDDSALGVAVGGDAPAYVMYTSGSTGTPKGVIVPHRAIVRLVVDNGFAAFEPDDRFAFASNPAFDASTLEVWAPLLNGGSIVVVDQDTLLAPDAFAALLTQQRVSVLWLTVGLFNQYADALREQFAKLRYLITGGDALDPTVVRRVLRQGRPAHLLNGYGPTETTTFAATYEIDDVPEGARSVPIGHPIGNTRIYVLDDRREPVPVGVVGELYVGGLGVAHGYLNRPELTAERFVDSPFVAGDRLYRTGDVGRWLADGTIEFVGRNDGQVKLRGFRIELGEIEAALVAHASVAQATVIVRADDGEKRLVAYYTSAAEPASADALREHLAAQLPEYMIPAAFMALESIPLTPNGKVDRRALPSPDASSYAAAAYEPPQGAIETAIAATWAGLLNLEQVSRNDHFFQLGGHSLLAVRAVTALREQLHVDVAVRHVFAHPVLKDLARSLQGATSAELPRIVPAERTGDMPMSFAQQRLWFLAQMDGVSEAYHIPFGFQLHGALDRRALGAALDRIVLRHEALRTTFHSAGDALVQRIAPPEQARFVLREDDVRGAADPQAELRRLIAAESTAPFDLERGPVVRGRLIREAEASHTLLITMHHIVSDGWSMGVFIDELSALYDAFARALPDPLPPPAVQYADYAVWQRRWIEGDVLQRQARYWAETLAGAPAVIELPTDRPRPAQQDYRGAYLAFELDEGVTADLKTLALKHDATLFMTLLAAWSVVLSRLSGQDDVVVGTPVANRGYAEIEDLIGFFVNTLALRLDLSAHPTFAQLLAAVKERALAAQQHQDIPFEQVVELTNPARSLAYSPLVQVMFAWQSAPRPALALTDLRTAALPRAEHAVAKWDLSLFLRETGGRITGGIEYATALFDSATVERFAAYLRNVVAAMLADDAQTVDRAPLLAAGERQQLLTAWNDTERALPGASVAALFEQQVARAPHAVAVIDGERALTYAELNARANRLARHLHAHGVAAGAKVAVLLERSPELIVAELAILKCGAAYVPLDPNYPADRLRFLLDDAGTALVVSHAQAWQAEIGSDLVVVDARAEPAERDDANLGVAVANDAPAYVMYTSGSTGTPKGVIVPHRAIVRLVVDNGFAAFVPSDRVAFASNPAFDASTLEVWAPLLTGGAIVVVDQDTLLAPDEFGALLAQQRVSVLWLTVGLFNQYADALRAEFAKLRYLITGGDALDPTVVRRVLRQGRPAHLLNGYGPTETTTFAATYEIEDVPEGARSVPIGRPIGNTRIYVLDAHREPVPAGVIGELYIGGLGVAHGYLNRPDLTAERFIDSPFVPGDRLYKTGDLGRRLAGGTIEFAGRNDDQVKLRGFRIELGEIEAALVAHAGVAQATAIVRDDDGDKRLVAYYASAGGPPGAEALREHLSSRLPEYMIPAAFIALDAIPLTANGKVDRRALPAPDASSYAAAAYEPPHGEAETAIAAIWGDLLDADRVSRHDHFFQLGGHSLLAVRAVTAIRDRLGVDVAVRDVFAHPVLKDLARSLAGAARAELPRIVPVQRTDRMPMSFAQQRLWFLAQMDGASEAYNVPYAVRLRGRIDAGALRAALNRIVQRHEALRTTFAMDGTTPVQRVVPAERAPFALREEDVRGHDDASAAADRAVAAESAAPFDLECGPVIRGLLIREDDAAYMLAIVMHHIVSDGWSMGVFLTELSALYDAFAQGRPDPLEPLPVQYADYAVWQRAWIEGDVLHEQARYWTHALAGAPALLELPADRPRPPQQDHRGAVCALELDERLSAAVRALARRHDTTLFMTLLTAWSVVLSRLSGQNDLVIGTPVANRGFAEIEGLIGFFVNTLALRIDLGGAPTVSDALARVKARVLAAQQHEDIPFEQVVELANPVRSLAHSPVFQALFAWQSAPFDDLRLAGAETSRASRGERSIAKFDLTLWLRETGERIAGGFEYATALFDAATVERFGEYLRVVLEAMVADDRRQLDRVPLLPAAERDQVVVAWNDTARPIPSDGVAAVFERQAHRAPDAIAVIDGERATSYAELNARANRLARHLRAQGVASGARVAILLERSTELVVAQLAILKAGAAYVPLDPNHPPERLRFLLDDAGAAVVVSNARAWQPEIGAFMVVDAGADLAGVDDAPLGVAVDGDALAYVMYTSGSTGTPKGVMVPHRAIVRLVVDNGFASFEPSDRVALASNPAFDASTLEMWAPLLTGGSIVVVDQDTLLAPAAFGELLTRQRISVLWLTVGLFNQYADALKAEFAKLRYLITGGDALDPTVVRRVLRQGRPAHLLNGYGPTETTTFAATYEIDDVPEGARSVPIGRPIGNTRIYVLDERREPVPVGVIGELYIGGLGVAHGYLNRADLTAERFIDSPFVAGDRLYRTGDLGRWLAGGTIEFVGRNDDQVKLRGFRIELGEIEAALVAHAGVAQATAIVREDGGEKRLVAYYVSAAGDAAGAEALRAHLADRLPGYMIPAAFVRVESIPLTANGKVDRRALPEPGADAYAAGVYEAPQGEIETALAAIWAKLLKLDLERVGRRDDFFELGGHSLLAIRAITLIREALSIDVSVRDVFARPVLNDLAELLHDAARSELPPIVAAERRDRMPVSFAQQRLWFLAEVEGAGHAYHMPFGFRLQGELDAGALQAALDRIVARHESLRTTFATADGEPVQVIAPAEHARFDLRHEDVRERGDAETHVRRLAAAEAAAPFDLERGPVIRGVLVRDGETSHTLLITMHHIVSDGWSMGVFFKELSALYDAFAHGRPDPLAPLAVQYADYALWQRRWLTGDVLQRQASYWANALAGAPALLNVPLDRPRPAVQEHGGATVPFALDAELTAALKRLSRRHGTTLFMTLIAAWGALLARLSDQSDVVIGTPVANRNRLEVEELIGFFVNTLALRLDFGSNPTVAQLLADVKSRALEAQEHQDLPFEQVVEIANPPRSLAHAPLFQVMFIWQNNEGGALALPGLELSPLRSGGTVAKFDLTLGMREVGGTIAGSLEYATALFDARTVERYLEYLRALLAGMAVDEERRIEDVPLMSEAERHRVLVAWNATDAPYPAQTCVHELFEAHAAAAPDTVAAVYEDQRLSYGELNARANRLAHHLRALGVQPDTRVGLCLEPSLDLIVAVLAVLKAGGAYLPLDPAYPLERLRYLLDDGAPAAVLTQATVPQAVRELLRATRDSTPVIDVGADAERWCDLPASNPERGALTPDHLAYVIHTSGSTGQPKGAMVEHRSCVNRIHAQAVLTPFSGGEVFSQKAALGFVDAFFEIVVPLCWGKPLVVIPKAASRDAEALFEALERNGVTHLVTVPSLAAALRVKKGDLPRLRSWFLSGEVVSPQLACHLARSMSTCLFTNIYGATELTADAVTYGFVGEAGLPDVIPIGRPVANTRVYILDAHGQPVPPGVGGDIFVGGVQVARGYLNRPDLTAERFMPSPFVDGERLYKTGDLGRWLPDGTIEFLGRRDFQVKIRGIRIELGEIETALARHDAVREAVVVAREDALGEQRLIAYYLPARGADRPELRAAELRAFLASRLPEHMLPAAFVALETMPLTPNGKVDRRALPAPDASSYAAAVYEAPHGAVETAIAAIWAELLKTERVGRQDHFFQLGGHSLLAVRAVTAMRAALGVHVAVRDVFAHPVLADLAALLEHGAGAKLPPIVPVERRAEMPMSFAQQRLWLLAQMDGGNETYNMPFAFQLRGTLDAAALRAALDGIVARHEALRTTFGLVGETPVQRIAPVERARFALRDADVRHAADAGAERRRLLADEAKAPFDVANGPLIRGLLVRDGEASYTLAITMHHIVSDGWSMGVFLNELSALYDAFAHGRPDPLPPLAVQYADYAVWQRTWIDGEILHEQAQFWTGTLAGAPPLLELPADRPRPVRQDYRGAFLEFALDERLTSRLKALSLRHDTTLFMTLLAAWSVVLSRLSGQDDVVVGTPVANREHAEIQALIGFFVNTLALRIDLSGSPTVSELLATVKAHALAAQQHQDIPFEQVVELAHPVRSMAHSPLFQVMFAWQNVPRGSLSLSDVELVPAASAELTVAKVDLTLYLREAGGTIAGGFEYASALFDRATVERFGTYLRLVLEAMVADDAQRVADVPMLPAAERHQVLVEWNDTARAIPDAPVHVLFERQAARTPAAVAVVDGERELTYAELSACAARLARHLRAQGVEPGSHVAVMLERSPEMVIADLAILTCGAAYVPLDPAYPPERLRFLLDDAAPALVVSRPATWRPEIAPDLAVVDVGAEHADAVNGIAAAGAVASDAPAYVMYTSGSTGRPKGVVVPHRGIVRLAIANGYTDLRPSDRVACLANPAFDASTFEIWAPLLTGGRIVILSRDTVLAPEAFAAELTRRGVTAMFVTTALFNQLAAERNDVFAGLRYVLFGGELVDPRRVADVLAHGKPEHVLHMYGPTEATTYATFYEITRAAEEGRTVPIGRPIGNTRVYVLDGALEPVPVGVTGELYVGGLGVALGYLNRPDLTAERFIASPFVDGDRLYKTGDLGRWLPDGVIEFVGRNDDQIKLRGFRIELPEIEAALMSTPSVAQAVVLVYDADGEKRLVAYYTAAGGDDVSAEQLRAQLATHLPDYMIPAAFVQLETIPLTPNGKLDRKALPKPDESAYAGAVYEEPQGEVEEALAEIWSGLLKVERISRNDNFFALGGHSLLAVRAITATRASLDVEVTVGDLFAKPVLKDLADHVILMQLEQFDPEELQNLLGQEAT